MKLKHGLALLAGVVAFIVVTAFSNPKSFEYSVVSGDPRQVQSEINSLARNGWEPITMGAGGGMVVSGEMNSATNYGARLYVLMRRKR